MQQKTISLLQFQKKFGTEKACQTHLRQQEKNSIVITIC